MEDLHANKANIVPPGILHNACDLMKLKCGKFGTARPVHVQEGIDRQISGNHSRGLLSPERCASVFSPLESMKKKSYQD
jgi:hypothetical protein